MAIGGFVPVDKVYSLEPVPASLTNDEKKFIVGVQANLWTEYIPTFSHVEYMVLPRMAALSEVQWTMPEKKDYQDFLNRLSRFRGLYDLNGYIMRSMYLNRNVNLGRLTICHSSLY